MAASKIRAGQAYVEVGVKDRVDAGLKSIGMKLQRFGAGLAFIGTGIAGLGGTVLGALAGPIQEAANYQETLNKFRQVFGDQTAAATEFAQTLAKTVGRDVGDVMQAMAASQSMFRGLDFAPEKAREMSEMLAQLALDFASFHNISDPEAFDRFRQALSGSAEVMDQFGVNVKETALKQKMLEMGAKRVNGQYSEQDKLLARIAIIQEAMNQQGATGDAFRTKGGFVNMRKAAESQWERIKRVLGTPILPIGIEAFKVVFDVLKSGADVLERNPEFAAGLFAVAAGAVALGTAMAVAGVTIAGVGIVLANFLGIAGAVIAVVGFMWGVVFSPIGAGIGLLALLVAGLGGLAAWFVQNTAVGQVFAAVLGSALAYLWSTFTKVWGGIVDAVMAGDLSLAFQIAWKAIQVAFLTGVDAILTAWEDMSLRLRSVFAVAMVAVGGVAISLVDKLLKIFNGFSIAASASIESLAQTISNRLSGLGIEIPGLDALTNLPALTIDRGFLDDAREALSTVSFDQSQAGAEAERQRQLRGGLIDAAAADRDRLIAEAAKSRSELELPSWDDFFGQFDAAKDMEAAGSGTFSAAGARLLGRSVDPQERTAKASEEAAKTLKEIDRHLLESQLSFTA